MVVALCFVGKTAGTTPACNFWGCREACWRRRRHQNGCIWDQHRLSLWERFVMMITGVSDIIVWIIMQTTDIGICEIQVSSMVRLVPSTMWFQVFQRITLVTFVFTWTSFQARSKIQWRAIESPASRKRDHSATRTGRLDPGGLGC